MSLHDEITGYWASFSNVYVNNLLDAFQQIEIDDNDFIFGEEDYHELEIFFEQSYIWPVTKENIIRIIEVANMLPTKILMYYMQHLAEENADMFNAFYTIISSEPNNDFQYLLKRCICFEKCQVITKVMCYERLHILEKVLTLAMDEA
ncbi:hypothetical protein [Fangia hongkongensis]|uniref:type IVB secretion system protein IcmW n=1 Tax=Fangia hongkongensis TaxID=270495 RepID=UPI000362B92B|nr:hypothetical protein [Fangia hongkongensis]MBK2123859.1 hypothetical protein [Fangia hongkongensis]